MVSGKTHLDMTRCMFPTIQGNVISQVNHALDKPSLFTKQMIKAAKKTPFYQNQVDFPGLSRRGHRAINHDLTSALMTGYMVGGSDGMLAAFSHLMEDAMSDTIARTVTPEGRDIFEALYHYNRRKQRQRRYKPRVF